jgi:cytochrome c553
MKSKTLWGLALTGVCLALGGQAAQAAGDAEEGKKKFFTCAGCHAFEGYSNAVPNYPVPRIGGQHAEVVLAALEAYKKGDRQHGSMQGNANSWSQRDLEDIAAYVSKKRLASENNPLTGNPAAGKAKAAESGCEGCHGEEEGKSTAPNPRLAGQYEAYLVRALKDYKKGSRKNPIMNGMAGMLSEQEMKDVAAYYASQKRGVVTISE